MRSFFLPRACGKFSGCQVGALLPRGGRPDILKSAALQNFPPENFPRFRFGVCADISGPDIFSNPHIPEFSAARAFNADGEGTGIHNPRRNDLFTRLFRCSPTAEYSFRNGRPKLNAAISCGRRQLRPRNGRRKSRRANGSVRGRKFPAPPPAASAGCRKPLAKPPLQRIFKRLSAPLQRL